MGILALFGGSIGVQGLPANLRAAPSDYVNGPFPMEPSTIPAPPLEPQGTSSRALIVTVVIGVVLVLGIAAASLFLANQARQEATAALEALESEREEADAAVEAAEAAADAVASEAAAAQAEEAAADAARAAADDAERGRRELAVGQIEESVSVLAEEHVTDGLIDGPILDVSCSPIAGGSLDDLAESTTVFEYFVATEESDDGRARGFTYNATMNWDSGNYTYGLGSP